MQTSVASPIFIVADQAAQLGGERSYDDRGRVTRELGRSGAAVRDDEMFDGSRRKAFET
jgi:hypothetical protein